MRHSKRSREERRQDAVDRDAERAKRTPKEQLKLINRRPGASMRERAKLRAELDQQPKKKTSKKKGKKS